MSTSLRLPVQRGMDVYDAYQEQYLGTVVRVWRVRRPAARQRDRADTAETQQREPASVPLTHEEGAQAGHARAQERKTLGEELGPAPTMAAGNTGPVVQSAEHDYATGQEGHDAADVVLFAVRPGRINLGPLTRPLYIPAGAVRSIAMDRIVVDMKGGDIPRAWRRPPRVI